MSMYKELIKEGTHISTLLEANSGNVGDIGELLILAAVHIENLEADLRDTREYFVKFDKIAKVISQNGDFLQGELNIARIFRRVKL
jgi:hypothetical protein